MTTTSPTTLLYAAYRPCGCLHSAIGMDHESLYAMLQLWQSEGYEVRVQTRAEIEAQMWPCALHGGVR